MHDLAIKVEGLSKKYHITGPQKRYKRLSEQLADTLFSSIRRVGNVFEGQARTTTESEDTIWALRDVNLEVRCGEVVGVIGRNGAGKTTLLKILSRITYPNDGYAEIYGRVGSLLEVGTGFHPELTGLENIYLNGAILGMRKAEIEQKLDEIIAFAEVEKFIDTPVKHYSSGMYVRLAFSVAAHLEPEILLVDEVLAVGDLAFQRKCLGKMDDVSKQGRTVLFVSHNMSLMQTLCQRGIFLDGGRMVADGSIGQVVDAYLSTLEKMQSEDLVERIDRRGQGQTKLVGVEVSSISYNGSNTTVLKTGQSARFTFQVSDPVPGMACTFSVYDHIGQPVSIFRSRDRSPDDDYSIDKDLKFICDIDELLLLPGRYRVDVSIIGDNRIQDFVEAAAFFDVGDGQIDGRPIRPDKKFRVSIPHRWILPNTKS